MPGFSVSLFLLPREGESKYTSAELLELLDAPADAPGWAWTSRAEPRPYKTTSSKSTAPVEAHSNNSGAAVEPTSGKAFIGAIQQACKDVIAAEPEITRYDTYVCLARLQSSHTYRLALDLLPTASPATVTAAPALRQAARVS